MPSMEINFFEDIDRALGLSSSLFTRELRSPRLTLIASVVCLGVLFSPYSKRNQSRLVRCFWPGLVKVRRRLMRPPGRFSRGTVTSCHLFQSPVGMSWAVAIFLSLAVY